VTFNMCQSTDPDAGDELKFTYDFDADGGVDFFGHCRASHSYVNDRAVEGCTRARVCVSDRGPDHAVCQSYTVCVAGRAEPDPAAPSGGAWAFSAQGGASWSQGGAEEVRIGFQDSATCGGANGTAQSGTATYTLVLATAGTLSITGDGMGEQLDKGFERATVSVDGVDVASGASPGGGLRCSMAPLTLSAVVQLAPGIHTIRINATTGDGTDHLDAYWRFQLAFKPL
jgi:hypothetical protein